MPISASLRKLLCCAPVRQEEETNEMPPRRPLPEPVEAAPAQPGRPHREYVENEADSFWEEMVAASLPQPGRPYPEHAGNGVDRKFWELLDDFENLAEIKKIPLPEHPQPQHPPIHFTTDPESGRPIRRRGKRHRHGQRNRQFNRHRCPPGDGRVVPVRGADRSPCRTTRSRGIRRFTIRWTRQADGPSPKEAVI